MTQTIINDPTGDRYGLPTFVWGHADPGVYATRRQLTRLGLRKAGQDVAAQKAANARKKCDVCGACWPQLQYVPRNGVCNPCTDVAWYAEERAA